jgi:LDH2 family malate/lactate/ureidoglycolate dehydrogenase
MRRVAVETLERTTRDIFAGWKAPREDATWIATLLVRANLRGHDSHGVIRIPHYVRAIKAGEVNPNPSITIESETPTIAQIDGDKGFGQVVARRGITLAIDKEILIPGDPEARTSRERRAGGVPIDDETWRQIKECAVEVGVDA